MSIGHVFLRRRESQRRNFRVKCDVLLNNECKFFSPGHVPSLQSLTEHYSMSLLRNLNAKIIAYSMMFLLCRCIHHVLPISYIVIYFTMLVMCCWLRVRRKGRASPLQSKDHSWYFVRLRKTEIRCNSQDLFRLTLWGCAWAWVWALLYFSPTLREEWAKFW